MTRKIYPYSLKSEDAKIAGVCSTLGQIFNVDPTFIRVGFVAFALIVEPQIALVAYVAAGIYFHLKKRKAMRGEERLSDFDRMERSGKSGRGSIHDMRTQFDANDRRMMAIDHHLNQQNDELAREIEALREGK